MKKILRISFVGLMLSLVVFSCTVERRIHNSGFHVKWNKCHSTSNTEEVADNTSEKLNAIDEITTLNVDQEAVLNQGSKIEDQNKDILGKSDDVSDQAINSVVEKRKVESISVQNQERKTITKFKNKKTRLEFKKERKNNSSMDEMTILLLILCFLLPFLAVGLATDWDVLKVLICLLLMCLFWIPGIVYALLVVLNKI